MGQQQSHPQPGAKLQVIGAGLPRTGTASFAAALEILLQGPVYHGGTQVARGPESRIRRWTEVLRRTPIRSAADEKFVEAWLRREFDGYVATADAAPQLFVEELMVLHPDAKVVCTVRDADSWATSIGATVSLVMRWFLPVVLFWVPTMRYFPAYIDALTGGRWAELYYLPGEVTTEHQVVERHMAWLKAVVPKERLFFVDVKDGWEPLCKALGCEIPQGVDFPRVNDTDAMTALVREQIMYGLARWAVVFGVVGSVAAAWSFLR